MSDSGIAFRPAGADDVGAIVAIERAAFTDPWTATSFFELLGRSEIVFEVATSVGVDGGVVVGFAVAYLVDYEGDLANLAVGDSVRRQGVGRRLLGHVLDIARSRGVRIIFLEVRESNDAARALYASEGFMEVGRRAKYYVRPTEDALILRKEFE